MKSIPPPQPCGVPLEWFRPLKSAQVPKAPISNSLPLKNSGGGGGGGAITCFEDTTGSPAKTATACDAIAKTVKTIIFFISVMLSSILTLSCKICAYLSKPGISPLSDCFCSSHLANIKGSLIDYSLVGPYRLNPHALNLAKTHFYHDGSVASARHGVPVLIGKNGDFNDRWELYDLRNDFSQAHDLASVR